MTLTREEIEALISTEEPKQIQDYESLAKRLLGCMYYGIRIEPYAGHRWIIIDLHADELPDSIREKYEGIDDEVHTIKEYGSVVAALNVIDKMLEEARAMTTLEAYSCYIMEDIDGEGTIDESRVFSEDETV